MKKTGIILSLAILIVVSITYGFLVSHKNIFPYFFIKHVYQRVTGLDTGPWSVGMYIGDSPFNLKDNKKIHNPIIEPEDATDVKGMFVADPFMQEKDGKYYIFFELLNRFTAQGDIAYAESSDMKKWVYKQIVVDEDFHLSYPHVFEWEGDYYMIPESGADFSVRIYKASNFPNDWEYLGNILEGFKFADPTVFRHDDKWWMFVSYPGNSALYLYYSDELMGKWLKHPSNPIRTMDKKHARLAGRIFTYNDKLYRLAQDSDRYYGEQVFCFEILELTDSTYTEKLAQKEPLIHGSGKGWNAKGMHHLDLHYINGKWVGIVDGQKDMTID